MPNSATSAPHLPQPVTFSGTRGRTRGGPAGTADDAFARILPSGRILRPAGTSVVVGMNALGFALTPDGRYAIVSNDDERETKAHSALDPLTTGGYSLAVVDTATMTVVSRYRSPNATFFAGVVGARRSGQSRRSTLVLASGGPSNAVYAFDLASATERCRPTRITRSRFPRRPTRVSQMRALVPGHDRARERTVRARTSSTISATTSRRSIRRDACSSSGPPVPAGFFPFGAALSSQGLLVAQTRALTAYGVLPAPTIAPPFANVAPDLARASSLTIVPFASRRIARGGDRADPRFRSTARPTACVRSAARIPRPSSRSLAPVCLRRAQQRRSRRDGVARTGRAGRARRRTAHRRRHRVAPVRSRTVRHAADRARAFRDERRLYVALAGIDAVAVLDTTDPVHPHRVGLIPTGWYPDALALSGDGRYLYVANAKGLAEDRGLHGRLKHVRRCERPRAEHRCRQQRRLVDLRADRSRCGRSAAQHAERARQPAQSGAAAPNAIVPQRFLGAGSSAIKHVVLILEENKTYDSMLGDLTDAAGAPYGPGDPGYVSFGASSRRICTRSRARSLSRGTSTRMPRSPMRATSSSPPASRAISRRRRCS
jgi:hypothetical protein